MNSFKSDKGRQVVFGVRPDDPGLVIYLGELKRDKNKTAETALREWAATSEEALDLEGYTCVVATIDTDRYRVTVRKVADIEVVNESMGCDPGLLEIPQGLIDDPPEEGGEHV